MKRPAPPLRCLATAKVSFRTEGAAWERAYALWQRRGEALRAYRCRFCPGWHLTKQRRHGRGE